MYDVPSQQKRNLRVLRSSTRETGTCRYVHGVPLLFWRRGDCTAVSYFPSGAICVLSDEQPSGRMLSKHASFEPHVSTGETVTEDSAFEICSPARGPRPLPNKSYGLERQERVANKTAQKKVRAPCPRGSLRPPCVTPLSSRRGGDLPTPMASWHHPVQPHKRSGCGLNRVPTLISRASAPRRSASYTPPAACRGEPTARPRPPVMRGEAWLPPYAAAATAALPGRHCQRRLNPSAPPGGWRTTYKAPLGYPPAPWGAARTPPRLVEGWLSKARTCRPLPSLPKTTRCTPACTPQPLPIRIGAASNLPPFHSP